MTVRGSVRADVWLFVLVLAVPSGIPLAVASAAGPAATDSVWFVVGTSGPTLAAIVLWLAGRRLGSRPPLTRRLAAAPRWVPASIVLGVLPPAAGLLVAVLLGRTFDPGQPLRLVDGAGGPLLALLAFLLAGPLAEELGWRGFLQPRLRRLLSPVATAAALGSVWALWHVPLFFVDGTTQARAGLISLQAVLYLLAFLPMSFLAWFVCERLRGGVAAAVLMHLAFNIGQALLRTDPLVSTAASTATMVLLAVLVHRVTDAGRIPLTSPPACPGQPPPGRRGDVVVRGSHG